jgi:hypothetical protein
VGEDRKRAERQQARPSRQICKKTGRKTHLKAATSTGESLLNIDTPADNIGPLLSPASYQPKRSTYQSYPLAHYLPVFYHQADDKRLTPPGTPEQNSFATF